MIECETTLRNWGNSLGIVIPKDKIIAEGFHAKQRVKLIITPLKIVKVNDIFGKSKTKFNTAKEHKELNHDLDSKFF